MANENAKKGYPHWVLEAKPDPEWKKKLELKLIKTNQELKDLLLSMGNYVAWDLETSSLSPEEGFIVGVALTDNPSKGYYVPIRHHTGESLGDTALKMIDKMLHTRKMTFLFNARFDLRFWEWAGFDGSTIPFFDVQDSCWIADTNVKKTSLKFFERHFLGWLPDTFSETLGDKENFYYVTPEDAYPYACIMKGIEVNTLTGPRRIEDCQDQYVETSIGYQKVLRVIPRGLKQTVKVIHPGGELICTPDHRLAVETPLGPMWVEAGDLSPRAKFYQGGNSIDYVRNLSRIDHGVSFDERTLQDQELMYYLGGLALADGHIWQNRLSLKLSQKDEGLLCDLKERTNSQATILKGKGHSPSYPDREVISRTLNLSNPLMMEALRKMGLVEAKTGREVYQNIPDEWYPHFLRGFYDGDGSSNGHNLCFIGCETNLQHIAEDLERFLGIKGTLKARAPGPVGKEFSWVLWYNRRESIKLYHFMYDRASIFNRRKEAASLKDNSVFEVELESPEGEITHHWHIADAAEYCGYEPSSLSAVANGKRKATRGWKVRRVSVRWNRAPQGPTIKVEPSVPTEVYDLTVDREHNFKLSQGILVHNCVDAAGTMTLAYHTMPYWQEAKQAGKIDQAMLYPLMKWENTRLPIDREILEEIATSVNEQIQELQQRIYQMAGIQFKINSNRDCTEVFERLGIDTGQRIKTGYMKVGIPELNATNREHPHPILKDMIAYKKLFKIQSGYVNPLLEIAREGYARFAYLTCRAPTARFASGKDGKNPFFSPINVQSIPKPKPTMWYVREATQEEIERGEDILGYHMSLTEKSDMWMEGFDPKLNLRRAFIANPDNKHYFVSCDMCLEGGTPVISNRGYMGISELKAGDKVRTPNGWATVLDVHETEVKKLTRTRTDNQAIYSSPDHPFIMDGKEVRAEDMTTPPQRYLTRAYNEEWEARNRFRKELEQIKSQKLTPYQCADEIRRRGWTSKIEEGMRTYSRGFVADSLGINRSSMYHVLTQLGLGGNGKRLQAENFWVCNNPFEGESTPTSAYLLGYIIGDGSITAGQRNCLNISSKDEAHLEQMASVFSGSSQVTPRNRGDHRWYALSINSKEVVGRLLELGVKPDKSHRGVELPIEWLGTNLPHLIRGIIDSDGSILLKKGVLSISMYGHESYIEQLGTLLGEPTRGMDSIKGIDIHGDRERKKLIYKALYAHATLWLQRKRDAIEQYLGIFDGKDEMYWPMYDITIDSPDHLYYAGGVVTHNSGEELRIVANLYKEPVWVNAFLHDKDVHKETAIACFGEENYDKQKRRMAKVVNFGKIYGMCYSEDTEVLTINGFKHHWEIEEDTLIAQVEPVTHKITYVRAGKKHYGSNGEMVRIVNKTVDLLVTPNHHIYYKTNKENSWQKGEAQYRVGQKIYMQHAGTLDGEDITEPFHFDPVIDARGRKYTDELFFEPDAFIEMLGFYLGDGHVGKHGSSWVIHLYQSLREDKSYRWLLDLNRRLGDFFHVSEDRKGRNEAQLYRSNKVVAEWIMERCIIDGIKRVPEFVFHLSVRQKELFLRAFARADGSYKKHDETKSVQLSAEHKELIEDLQRVAISCGHKTYLRNKDGVIWRMTVYNEGHAVVANSESDRVCGYTGTTFCYTVPTGLLMVRRNGKVTVCGNSPQSMNEKFPELTIDFCEQFMRDYVKGLPYIFSGQDRDIRRAKKEGTVYTVFGRPRRVKYWLQSSDPRMRGFGARTVKNSQVQGAGGDLLRLMVKRIWDKLFTSGTYDIEFRSTVHDEINFSVARDQALEIIPKIIQCMTVKVPGWPVPMICGLEVGTSWGQTFAFDYDLEKGTYTPHWEPVPDDPGDQPEEPEEEEIDPDIFWEEETEDY